jgi:hypothetical protein
VPASPTDKVQLIAPRQFPDRIPRPPQRLSGRIREGGDPAGGPAGGPSAKLRAADHHSTAGQTAPHSNPQPKVRSFRPTSSAPSRDWAD